MGQELLSVEQKNYTSVNHVLWQRTGVGYHENQCPVNAVHCLPSNQARRRGERGVKDNIAELKLFNKSDHRIAKGNEIGNVGFVA